MNFQKHRNLIIITIFALSLTTPLVAMVLKLDRSLQLRENRERANFPAIAFDTNTLKKFPHDFYAYFRDNFGFRDAFIRLNFIVRRSILQELEFNDVLFGKNGWLFYLGEREMDDSRGITHYDDETLAEWTASLERKRQWLAAQGIRYLFVIAPNKETIYGENLPPYFRKLQDRTQRLGPAGVAFRSAAQDLQLRRRRPRATCAVRLRARGYARWCAPSQPCAASARISQPAM